MTGKAKFIRVPVDVEATAFWRLAAIAEQLGMRVDDYLADLAHAVAKSRSPFITDPIVQRWRLGMADREIAAELGLTNVQVAARRQMYGLPANRKSRHLAVVEVGNSRKRRSA